MPDHPSHNNNNNNSDKNSSGDGDVLNDDNNRSDDHPPPNRSRKRERRPRRPRIVTAPDNIYVGHGGKSSSPVRLPNVQVRLPRTPLPIPSPATPPSPPSGENGYRTRSSTAAAAAATAAATAPAPRTADASTNTISGERRPTCHPVHLERGGAVPAAETINDPELVLPNIRTPPDAKNTFTHLTGLTPFYTPRVPALFSANHFIVVAYPTLEHPSPVPSGRRLILTRIQQGNLGNLLDIEMTAEMIVKRDRGEIEQFKRALDITMRNHCGDGVYINLELLYIAVDSNVRRDNPHLRESYIPELTAALLWSFADDLGEVCAIQPDGLPRYVFLELPENLQMVESLELQAMARINGVVFVLPDVYVWLDVYLKRGLTRDKLLFNIGHL